MEYIGLLWILMASFCPTSLHPLPLGLMVSMLLSCPAPRKVSLLYMRRPIHRELTEVSLLYLRQPIHRELTEVSLLYLRHPIHLELTAVSLLYRRHPIHRELTQHQLLV